MMAFSQRRGKQQVRKAPLSKRATLEDVARAANVGAMTVSRVINNHPYVAEETAKRVRTAVRQLNYRANHAARMLGGQLSRSIGLIVPDISDSFFSVVIQAVQDAAREEGYLVWLAASNEDASIEAAQMESMTHHPVDGILLVPVDSKNKYLKAAVSGSIPVVTVDRPIEVTLTDSVEVDNRAGARAAVEHLAGHGCRRILCVAKNSHLRTIKERIAGYEEYMQHARLAQPRTLHLSNGAEAKSELASLLQSRYRPQALFTANNASTIWAIETLRELKVEAGKDIALVGFDDVAFYNLMTPPVTTISQPASELGRLSFRLLLQRIRADFLPSTLRTVLPVSLVIRESCGCRPELDH